MATSTPTIFAPAKKKLLTGGFNLTSDALKVALLTSSQALGAGFTGASGNAQYSDLTGEVANGNGYATGGQALASVALTYNVVAAAIVNAGTGGTNGTQTVTGTTGSGTKFQASVTIAGGVITAVNSISVIGAYTALPTTPMAEPVTGGGLTGATLALTFGVALTFTNPQWTSASFTTKYLVFYDNTAVNKDLLGYVDWDPTQANGVIVTNGTLIYQVNASGLFSLS